MGDRKEYFKKYRIENREKRKEYNKQWFLNNNMTSAEYSRKYYNQNKEKHSEYSAKYRENNKEKISIYHKSYAKTERGKINIKKNRDRYNKKKQMTSPEFRTNNIISLSMRVALKGNKAGRHWENLVNYSLKDLIKRLKTTMPQGYIWQDYLNGDLHLDHILPISAFEFDKPEDFQFQECWSLNNLRLLPAMKNIIKSNKITKSYQLALKI